jgi:c-di-GMP-binding flagellar brake protein YcgR
MGTGTGADHSAVNLADATALQLDGRPAERRRSRSERRSSRRLPLRVAVRQLVMGSAASPSIALAQSSDLGLGGMRLRRRCSADEPLLPVNTPLELAFELPGTRELVELRGEVVFDEAQGEGRDYRVTGVRFSDVSGEMLERLGSFLQRQP